MIGILESRYNSVINVADSENVLVREDHKKSVTIAFVYLCNIIYVPQQHVAKFGYD